MDFCDETLSLWYLSVKNLVQKSFEYMYQYFKNGVAYCYHLLVQVTRKRQKSVNLNYIDRSFIKCNKPSMQSVFKQPLYEE